MNDWFDGNGAGAVVDAVAVLDAPNVSKGLAEIVDEGALVSMGKTSDGGAIGVTITVDGRWRREYFRNEEELLVWIAEALPAVQAAKASPPASGVQGNRSRRSRGL